VKLAPLGIAIGTKPDGSAVALLVDSYAYEWPVDQVPALARALRACAAGDPAPAEAAGIVWAEGRRVVLTDKRPVETGMRFTVKRRGARELAAALEETLQQIRASRK
jgi:hypothetical protein